MFLYRNKKNHLRIILKKSPCPEVCSYVLDLYYVCSRCVELIGLKVGLLKNIQHKLDIHTHNRAQKKMGVLG